MIILRPYEHKILLPIPQWQWREPSLTQPKDQFGNQDRTRFVIEQWKRDGGLVDQRWFDDRDEFDAELWHVIQDPYADIIPMFATVTTLTGTAGSNQTYNVPADWNSANNSIECIGGGGSGGASRQTNRRVGTGGGGGGYGIDNNHVLTPSGTATYQLGLGGTGVTTPGTSTVVNGNDGGDTWFNGTTYALANVGATKGIKGIGSATDANGGLGGSGKGDASFSGGRGGNATAGSAGNNRQALGAGGAAGRNGAGGNGTDTTGTGNVETAGGTGDNGLGGAGGATNGGPGGNGTEMNSIGAGGGSSGDNALVGQIPGNYGAGSGGGTGADVSTNAGSATGAQGAIWVTYTPATSAFLIMFH